MAGDVIHPFEENEAGFSVLILQVAIVVRAERIHTVNEKIKLQKIITITIIVI